MNLRKIASTFALTAMVFASFIGVCKQTSLSCGMGSMEAMGAMTMGVHAHMDVQEDGCAGQSATCADASANHMTTLASLYPSVTTDVSSILLIVGMAFFVAWVLTTKEATDGYERLRARLRSLKDHLSRSVSPDYLVFAYSRGILNSKIYASS